MNNTTKIRVPIAVDEKGNCYVVGWAHADTKDSKEDYGDMEDQVTENHNVCWEGSKRMVVRWATIEVPLPELGSEIPGVAKAE